MKTLKIKYKNFELDKFYSYMLDNAGSFLGGNEDEMVLCAENSSDVIDLEVCKEFKYEQFNTLLKEGEYSLVFTLGCIDENHVIELVSGDKYQVKYSSYTIENGEEIYDKTDGISEGDLGLDVEYCVAGLKLRYKNGYLHISTVRIEMASICGPESVEEVENCGDLDLYTKSLISNFAKGKDLEAVLEDDRQLRVDYGIGFVFNNSKLVVTCPVGAMLASEESYNIEKEIGFLSGGPQFVFPCDALGSVYENMEMVQSHLGRPHNEFAFVMDVKDNKTSQTIDEIKNEFMTKYDVLNEYIEKGYDIKPLCYVENNIEKYALNEERLEKLNLVKVKAEEFRLEDFINTIKENMSDDIDEDYMVMNLRKSSLVDYIYVCSEIEEGTTKELVNRVINNDDKIYVAFAKISDCCMEFENVIACANEVVMGEEEDIDDIDMGSLNIGDIFEVGILIECKDKMLSFKVVNYISQTPSGQTLIQIFEDTGVFKDLATEFINEYVIY